jgi:hypothetical protein
MFTKECPTCNGIMQYSSKDSLRCAIKRGTTCCSPRSKQNRVGRVQSEESRKKISEANKGKEYNRSNLGKKESDETRRKKSIALKGRVPGFGGKSHSPETRQLHRERRLEDLDSKFPTGWTAPNYNKKACELFEEINQVMGWNGQHAERGGEVRMLGYFLDYYEPTRNVVIEYDEPRHEIPSVKAKDSLKQKEITELLNCQFIRIKQTDERSWIDRQEEIITLLKN